MLSPAPGTREAEASPLRFSSPVCSWTSLKTILGGSTPGNAKVGSRQYFNDAVYVVSKGGEIQYRYLFPDFTTPPSLTDLVQAAKKAAAQ
jgi:hypothetical protein